MVNQILQDKHNACKVLVWEDCSVSTGFAGARKFNALSTCLRIIIMISILAVKSIVLVLSFPPKFWQIGFEFKVSKKFHICLFCRTSHEARFKTSFFILKMDLTAT